MSKQFCYRGFEDVIQVAVSDCGGEDWDFYGETELDDLKRDLAQYRKDGTDVVIGVCYEEYLVADLV